MIRESIQSKEKRLKSIASYEAQGHLQRHTLYMDLKRVAAVYPNKCAVADGSLHISYSELVARADAYAIHMYQRGVRRGDVVAVMLPNSAAFVVALYGLWKIGAALCLMVSTMGEGDAAELVERLEPVEWLREEEEILSSFHENSSDLHVEDILVSEEEGYSDIAVLLLSGGTTGVPKLVPRSHCQVLCEIKSLARHCGVGEHTVSFQCLSSAHLYGFSAPGLTGVLSNGGTVVMCRIPDPYGMISIMETERVNFIATVPSFLKIFLEFYDEDCDLSSLQSVMVGGEKMEPELGKRTVELLGVKLIQGYGMTEGVCMIMTGERAYNSVGIPVSVGDEIAIVDENGSFIPDGEYGELVIRGPYTFSGYYGSDADIYDTNGYFHTGDKARISARDGYLEIAGRISMLINKAGEKVMPSEVEMFLKEYETIAEAAVIGVEDTILGQRIIAYVVTQDEKLCIEDVRAYMAERNVSSYKWPDELVTIAELPHTAVGKIDYKSLRNMRKEVV